MQRRAPDSRPVRTSVARPSSADEASSLAADTRAAGGRIVFTNGVFDILHPGHIRYLQDARTLGDALIVGVNSDRSVRAIKGPTRPVTPAHERAEILLSLAAVDAVVIFDDETPYALIVQVQPDVLVKGADWADDRIVGRDVVEARGGHVVRVPIRLGHSTTDLIARVHQTTPRS